MEKTKAVNEEELTELVDKILCKRLGFCPTTPEVNKIPDNCIPVLKIGESYVQYVKEKNAYRVWAKDGTFIGVVKTKNDLCKNLSEWSDGKYYGIK